MWFTMNTWLENFAYHINVEWWIFMLGGALAIVIAFITVSFHSYNVHVQQTHVSFHNSENF